MAQKSKARIKVRLRSTKSSFCKTTYRNKKANKLEKKCYDPIVNAHVLFTETKKVS